MHCFRKARGLAFPIEKIGWTHQAAVPVDARPHHHQPVRVAIRQRLEVGGVNDAEDGGAGRNAEAMKMPPCAVMRIPVPPCNRHFAPRDYNSSRQSSASHCTTRASIASEPGDRTEPTKRRARAPVRESEGLSPRIRPVARQAIQALLSIPGDPSAPSWARRRKRASTTFRRYPVTASLALKL